MIDVETKEEVHPILEIVDVYLAKIIKTDYTIIKERKNSLEYLLYLLVCNDEKILRVVYEGDSLMEKMVDEAKEIISNYQNMINEEKYNSDILGELNVFDEIYMQPARKNCALLSSKSAVKILDGVDK